MNHKTQNESSAVRCLKKALKEIDKQSHDGKDHDHLRPVVKQLCALAFGKHTPVKYKIEALKLITDTLGHDLAEGLAVTPMDQLIINRNAKGYKWAREADPKTKILKGSRVACLYEGDVYLVGKVIQFKYSKTTHIIEDQLTGELFEWDVKQLKFLSISECVTWIKGINQSRQADSLSLPVSHLEKLKAQHDI